MTERLIYWDTSAILSALFLDDHSDLAQKTAKESGVHLCSSLAIAESFAVIARMERQAVLEAAHATSARDTLLDGPWRFLAELPHNALLRDLSSKWPLRGADLWHLGCAKTLSIELPELRFFTFDKLLQTAAQAEGLV